MPHFERYGEYIWAAFGIAIAIILAMTLISAFRLKAAREKLERLEKEETPEPAGSQPSNQPGGGP
jgi:heme exporter protein D